MNVPQRLGLTLQEIEAMQEQKTSLWENPFQWKSEYLPFVVGVVGVVGAFLVVGIMKKRKKRGKK